MGKIKNRFDINKLNQVAGGAMKSAPKALEEKKKNDIRNEYVVMDIPVEKLQPMPYNRKIYNVDDLDWLGATISEYGLAQPLVVQKQPGIDMYTIVAGERRYQSYLECKENGTAAGLYPNGLPCHVYPEDMDETLIQIMVIITNATARARTAETQIKELEELIMLFQKAEQKGLTIAYSLPELAQKHLKIAKRQYQRYMSALRVIPELRPYTDKTDVIIASAIGSKSESVQQEIYSYLTQNDCSVEDAYLVMTDEYNKYRKQIQELEQLVDDLKQEKKDLKAQIELGKANGESVKEQRAQLHQSSKNLADTKQTIQQLKEHADEIIRSGIQKQAENPSLHSQKTNGSDSKPNTTRATTATSKTTPMTLSVNDAIQQINTGLNAIGLQMKRCDSIALNELRSIRDRIDKILQVTTSSEDTFLY